MTAQRVRMNVASMNMANKDTTRTEEGGAYRRRDVLLATENYGISPFAAQLRNQQSGVEGEYLGVRVDDIVQSEDPLQLIYDPAHPDANEEGYVELPNVNALAEMMNVMTASRAYEAGANIMKTVKQMAERAIRIGR